jgi:hypothetical protein
MTDTLRPVLPDGIVAVVKRDCPTCALVAPVLAALAQRVDLAVYTQDDPSFPEGVDAQDDSSLAVSWHWGVDAVPTLIRIEEGVEQQRVVGWHRQEWQGITGVAGLGPGLPDWRPGCGSLSAAVAACGAGFARGRLRGDVRARLERRSAAGSPQREAGHGHARGHDPQP